jgi:hypothetical protein
MRFAATVPISKLAPTVFCPHSAATKCATITKILLIKSLIFLKNKI